MNVRQFRLKSDDQPVDPRKPAGNSRASKCLTSAFATDPVMRALFPDDKEYFDVVPDMFRWMAWAYHDNGLIRVLEDEGGTIQACSIWKPPTTSWRERSVCSRTLWSRWVSRKRFDSPACN